MTRLTKTQGETLCALLRAFRHDWDMPGITAAVKAAADTGAAGTDIARRALSVAANPGVRTPALIGRPGPIVGEFDTPALPHRVATYCAEHPTEDAATCRQCIPATPVRTKTRAEIFAALNQDA